MKHSTSVTNNKQPCSHPVYNMISVTGDKECKKHHVPKKCNHPGCRSNVNGGGQLCKSHKSKKKVKHMTVAQDILDSVMEEVV